MRTVNERLEFDAVQKHLQMVENYLHVVIFPEEVLLRQAMQEYALSLSMLAAA